MDAARHALVVVAPRVDLDPAGEPVHLGVPSEHPHHAEELASASPYFSQTAVRPELLDCANLPRLNYGPRVPQGVVVALRVAGREVDAVRFAGFDHAVCLFQRDAHGLFAEDALDAGLDGRHDDLGNDGGRQDRRGYVDALVGEHLTVVGVPAFEAEPSPEQFEYLGVLLGDRDDLCARVELVCAGVLRALQPRSDDSYAIWRCHCGLLMQLMVHRR